MSELDDLSVELPSDDDDSGYDTSDIDMGNRDLLKAAAAPTGDGGASDDDGSENEVELVVKEKKEKKGLPKAAWKRLDDKTFFAVEKELRRTLKKAKTFVSRKLIRKKKQLAGSDGAKSETISEDIEKLKSIDLADLAPRVVKHFSLIPPEKQSDLPDLSELDGKTRTIVFLMLNNNATKQEINKLQERLLKKSRKTERQQKREKKKANSKNPDHDIQQATSRKKDKRSGEEAGLVFSSASEDEDLEGVITKKRNRPGQRARRAEYNAKSQERQDGFRSKRGGHMDRGRGRGGAQGRGGRRRPYHDFDAPFEGGSGANSIAIDPTHVKGVAKKQEPKKAAQPTEPPPEASHPSWAAKKAMQEKANASFSGKKVVFDDE